MGRAPLSLRLSRVLAVIEERARVRLHQAANRMEDNDPLAVSVARTGVRVLDALPAEAAGPLLAAWLDERRA